MAGHRKARLRGETALCIRPDSLFQRSPITSTAMPNPAFDSLSKPLQDRAKWLFNAGIEDTRMGCNAMTGTDDDMAVLRAAIEHEKQHGNRVSRLDVMQRKLSKFSVGAREALISSRKPDAKAGFAEILDKSANIPTKPDPAWDNARLYFRAVKTTGRQFIVAQICLGWELHNRKSALGFTHGGDRRSSGQVGHLIGKTWEEYLHAEIDPDLPRRTADRFIEVYQGFCEKCPKKIRVAFEGTGKRSLITTLSKPPASLTEKDRKTVEAAIAKCSDGETQRSLLEALRLVKVHVPLTGGDTSGHKKDKPSDAELMGQLAFKFFQPLADTLHGLRTDPDREAYLHTIPITSSEPDEISLTALEHDLEAALADIRAAKKARMKPANGKVIS